ncbi:hypothetical protein [Faecalispora jeddahensis]|uniref:hypothetical protein n=1 Tax=Faecalispora jeddahensis TaxID=1414721 RepID=UPI00189B40C8|nr:hypothetical protein [Faecalispora jeddahensis]
MPEITPLEAAEKLEYVYMSCSEKYSRRAPDSQRDTDFEYYLQAVRCAASYLRKIASGEYAPVVHGRWIESDTGWYHCSNCGDSCGALGDETPYKSERCPLCGAVMDKVVSE